MRFPENSLETLGDLQTGGAEEEIQHSNLFLGSQMFL